MENIQPNQSPIGWKKIPGFPTIFPPVFQPSDA
jgi:hypothetical protein